MFGRGHALVLVVTVAAEEFDAKDAIKALAKPLLDQTILF